MTVFESELHKMEVAGQSQLDKRARLFEALLDSFCGMASSTDTPSPKQPHSSALSEIVYSGNSCGVSNDRV